MAKTLETSADYVLAPISDLRIGAVLALPLMSEDGMKLLGAGVPITNQVLDGLKRRHIEFLTIAKSDLNLLKKLKTESKSANNNSSRSEQLSVCGSCSQPLPLRAGELGERVMLWKCHACGATYSGVFDQTCSPAIYKNVQPAIFEIDYDKLEHPPEALVGAVHCLLECSNLFEGLEKRTSRRFRLPVAVPTQPLNEQWCPSGEPVMMVISNISSGGMALLHTDAVKMKYLAVELPGTDDQRLQVVVEVTRRRAIRPFFEYGGKILTKAADPTA